jgi:AbrB family looped-hinge helix DNA binding protein
MVVSFNAAADDTREARPPMTQVKLSSKYQIVVPEDVRDSLGLKPGQLFDVYALDGHVVAVPVRLLAEAFGMFPGIDTTVDRDDEDRT